MKKVTKQFTKVPKEFINEMNILPSNELTIFTILLMTNTNKGICVFNLKELMTMLNISLTDTARINKIIDILEKLREKGLIDYYSDILLMKSIDRTQFKKVNIIYGDLQIPFTGENFVMIYDEEIIKVLEYCKGKKINKYNLMHMLLGILCYINNYETNEEYNLARPTFNKITEIVAINDNSIIKYLGILKELEILEYSYVGARVTSDGKIKNTNMIYCRTEDKVILEAFIKKELEKDNYININKDNKNKSNMKRSLKQKINKLEKSNKSKSDEMLLEELKLKYEELNQ